MMNHFNLPSFLLLAAWNAGMMAGALAATLDPEVTLRQMERDAAWDSNGHGCANQLRIAQLQIPCLFCLNHYLTFTIYHSLGFPEGDPETRIWRQVVYVRSDPRKPWAGVTK